MSIPVNHHYVSQCLIRNFFNSSGKIYLYDKLNNRYSNRKSPKYVFSEYGLNSTVRKDGEVDHSKVEEVLNRYFEADFPIHYNRLSSILSNGSGANLTELAESGKLAESMQYFLRMGIIGDMRTPFRKAEADDSINGVLRVILANATGELKAEFDELEQRQSNVKYKSVVDFKKVADEILSKMGELVFSVFIAEQGDCFLLPDCSSVTQRHKINEYFNPDIQEIAVVGLPLSSRIFICIESAKISQEKFHRIQTLSCKSIFNINQWIFDSAHQRVACSSARYLKQFVEKHICSKTEV